MTLAELDIESFRQEVRAFLSAAVPEDMARRTRHRAHTTQADLQEWNRILDDKGWAAPHWPVAYGGTGWSPMQQFVFEEECARADAPFLSYFGLRLVGPLVYTFGTQAQKDLYLEGMRRGTVLWCQGFSEPNAGSDLAAVRTTAVRDGDDWVINGQKIWTTEAHFADKMFCLTRTDPELRPQKGGLSMFLFDMDQPGITVRPILTIDGGHTVNEVFIENVRCRDEDILGALGQGWDQAKFLLDNERVANAQVPAAKRKLALLKAKAVDPAFGAPARHRPDIREALARLEIDLMGLEWQVLRELNGASGEHRGAAASGMKMIGSDIQQRLSDLAVEIAGPRAMIVLPEDAHLHDERPADSPADMEAAGTLQLFRRAATIYAGATEIQREIIAKQVFGL